MHTMLHRQVDFERLPEFRLLLEALARRRCAKLNGDPPGVISSATEKIIEALAHFIINRLEVELAYLAQQTNKPGLLTKDGAMLFENSAAPLFADDCKVLDLLVDVGFLKTESDGAFVCERFAKLNPHLAGNFKTPAQKGNRNSIFVRSTERQAAQQAAQQVLLLPTEIFKRADGSQMNEVESNKAVIGIATLDRCLGRRTRLKGEYTEGLVRDAAAVILKMEPEKLREFYIWIAENNGHAALPKTSEQIFAHFDNVFALMN